MFEIRPGGIPTHACAWQSKVYLLKKAMFKGLYLACFKDFSDIIQLI